MWIIPFDSRFVYQLLMLIFLFFFSISINIDILITYINIINSLWKNLLYKKNLTQYSKKFDEIMKTFWQNYENILTKVWKSLTKLKNWLNKKYRFKKMFKKGVNFFKAWWNYKKTIWHIFFLIGKISKKLET